MVYYILYDSSIVPFGGCLKSMDLGKLKSYKIATSAGTFMILPSKILSFYLRCQAEQWITERHELKNC
jgi:hypothetical protein